jgi:hypothetical protein
MHSGSNNACCELGIQNSEVNTFNGVKFYFLLNSVSLKLHCTLCTKYFIAKLICLWCGMLFVTAAWNSFNSSALGMRVRIQKE